MLADINSGLATAVLFKISIPVTPSMKKEQKKTPRTHSPCFHELKYLITFLGSVFVLCYVDSNCSESSAHVETKESSSFCLTPPPEFMI